MNRFRRIFAVAALVASVPFSAVSARGFVPPPVCGGSYSTVVAGIGTVYFGRVVAPASQAAILNTDPYCARQAFLNAGIGLGFLPGVDNLELQLLNLSFAGAGVTGTLTGTGASTGFESAGAPPGSNGRYATSGLWSYFDDGGWDVATSSGVNGFGFYGTDVGDMSASSLGLTYASDGASGTYALSGSGLFGGPTGTGNLFFLGVILNSGVTLTDAAFNANGAAGTSGYDDFTILALDGAGTALVLSDDGPGGGPLAVTPEPVTMTLMATGLIGMAGATRRRRRKAA